MKILDLFKIKQTQSNKSFDVADVVQEMFDEAGITPQRQGNMFMTVIDGRHCSFRTVLSCDTHSVMIYSPFVLPVPKHVSHSVLLEVERLNGLSDKAKIILKEAEDGYSLASMTNVEFENAPTTLEIKQQMIHNIDLMDDSNFRSLTCAILGYSSYDDVQKGMMDNVATENLGSNVISTSLTDGYATTLMQSGNVSSTRFAGRLTELTRQIIERESIEYHQSLDKQVLTAYNVATETERDIIRKMRYLIAAKAAESDNDAEIWLGRMEGADYRELYDLLK